MILCYILRRFVKFFSMTSIYQTKFDKSKGKLT